MSITSVATDGHTGVASLMKKQYLFVDHQYDVWHMAKGITNNYQKDLKLSIVVNSIHGSSPFLTTYGGLHKPVIMMHSFLLKTEIYCILYFQCTRKGQ